MFLAGIILGTVFKFLPFKQQNRAISAAGFVLASVFAFYFLLLYYFNQFTAVGIFQNFSATLESTLVADFFGGSAQFAAVVLLIILFEVSLLLSFAVEETASKYFKKRKNAKTAPTAAMAMQVTEEPRHEENDSSKVVEEEVNTAASKEESLAVDMQGLRKDEQSIMELFLYEKISQITPALNALQPEGYSFEGLPQLDWDIKHTRQTLDSLVRKGFLKSELVDKVITCTACGSANVRVRKLCPECNSLRLRKEVLIEHLSCGAIDRQSAFESLNGGLVCPRCNVKLQTMGEDYRLLPSSYACLNCNARSSEPLLVAKCDNCNTTAELDEEPEVYLYKYTANSELPLREMQQIKPIEVCTKFFRALGYKVVAPAYVTGRSGTKHLFDMLVLGKVSVVGAGNQAPQKIGAGTCKSGENTIIELLISSKRVELEEITRIYGMINDIDCESLIFVIPSMTENARNYASAYNMKVCEGKTIEEALVNWVIPKSEEIRA